MVTAATSSSSSTTTTSIIIIIIICWRVVTRRPIAMGPRQWRPRNKNIPKSEVFPADNWESPKVCSKSLTQGARHTSGHLKECFQISRVTEQVLEAGAHQHIFNICTYSYLHLTQITHTQYQPPTLSHLVYKVHLEQQYLSYSAVGNDETGKNIP